MSVKGTLFHELTHVITNVHYTWGERVDWTYDNDDEDKTIEVRTPATDSHHMWPQFWREGMTEKIANVINGELVTSRERVVGVVLGARADLEVFWRKKRFENNLHDALLTEKAAELRQANPAAYPVYRLMIDAFYAKLDWEAAGLTPEEAVTLGAEAFTETPEDASDNRARFIAAVNQAAHPGFFMKLQHAIDVHGGKLVTAMLLDSAFDAHDPKSLPFTMTKPYLDYKQLEELGAPQSVLEHEQKRIERYHQRVGKFSLLGANLQDERHRLNDKYGDNQTNVE